MQCWYKIQLFTPHDWGVLEGATGLIVTPPSSPYPYTHTILHKLPGPQVTRFRSRHRALKAVLNQKNIGERLSKLSKVLYQRHVQTLPKLFKRLTSFIRIRTTSRIGHLFTGLVLRGFVYTKIPVYHVN